MAKACLFLADGFEEVEGLTILDMLRRAGIEITSVSVTGRLAVTGAHGVTVLADTLFEDTDCGGADMLVLPGGMPGTANLGRHPALCMLLQSFNRRGKYIGAICAAPSLLGRLGILKGKKTTCFPGFEQALVGAVFTETRYAVDGNIITGRGMGTAIDFSGELIALLKSREEAEAVKESIMYYA